MVTTTNYKKLIMNISVYGTLRKKCGANYKMDNTEFIGISKVSLNFKILHFKLFYQYDCILG